MSDNGVHSSSPQIPLEALNRRTFAKTKSPKGPEWRNNRVVPAPWESSISTLFVFILFLFWGLFGIFRDYSVVPLAFASASLNRTSAKRDTSHIVI